MNVKVVGHLQAIREIHRETWGNGGNVDCTGACQSICLVLLIEYFKLEVV